jgi:hypothetical protein
MSRNTQRISTAQQKAAATKRHEAQTSEIHERISNEKALCKQSMLRQKELQAELTSMTLTARGAKSRAVVPSLPLLHGSSSGRVRTTKTTEIARVATDPYPIHTRGTYITSLRSFNNLTAFTLDQGAFEALDNITSSNTDDTYLGPAFTVTGLKLPFPPISSRLEQVSIEHGYSVQN